MTNPFSRIHNEKWVIPVSGLSALLGFMLVVSWINDTNRLGRYKYLTGEQQQRESINAVDYASYVSMKEEVERLQQRATSLEKALSENGKGSETLNEQLQSAKAFAAITELEGGGVKVTLKDNAGAGGMPGEQDLIHDIDILRVTNELFASGAEAIAVNGQRLMSASSIRCAGPTVLVDGVRLAAPYTILAIGDVETLYNGFTISGGIMTEIATASPTMIQIQREKSIRIPAYLGATALKHASVPKATK